VGKVAQGPFVSRIEPCTSEKALTARRAFVGAERARVHDASARMSDPEPTAVPRRLWDDFDPGDLTLWEAVQARDTRVWWAQTHRVPYTGARPSRVRTVYLSEGSLLDVSRLHTSSRLQGGAERRARSRTRQTTHTADEAKTWSILLAAQRFVRTSNSGS
jgi:hypothetical protein